MAVVSRSRPVSDGGTFCFDVPGAGDYSIAARLGPRVVRITGNLREAQEELAISLAPPAMVFGVLIDENTDEPISGARVRWADGYDAGVVTSPDGRFSLPADGGKVVHIIPQHHEAFLFHPDDVQWRSSKDHPATFRRPPGHHITARARDRDRQPLANAQVVLRTTVGTMPVVWSTMLDNDGKLEIGCLDGRSAIEGYALAGAAFVPFITHDPARVDLGERLVTSDAAITGRVSLPDGTPALEATVYAAPVHNQEMARRGGIPTRCRWVMTDRTGRFTLGGLTNAEYYLIAIAPACAPHVTRFDCGQAAVPAVEVRLQKGTLIAAGTIVDAQARPMAEAEVFAVPDRSGPRGKEWQLLSDLGIAYMWGAVSSDGTFAVHGPDAKTFGLFARARQGGKLIYGHIEVPAGAKDVRLELVAQ